ncbi:MAG: relaxase/mobilization nuclease domain-containing protein, partial [Bacilli bacterium]
VDGKRYCNTKKDLYSLRTISDDLCREYGLSVVEEKAYKSKTRKQYHHEKSLESIMKRDIDNAIKVSTTRTNFFNELQFEGYELIRVNGEVTLKHYGHNQVVLLNGLGEGYSIQSIESKIIKQLTLSSNDTVYSKKGFDVRPYYNRYHKKELTGFQKLYIHYQFKLGILPRVNNTKPKYSKELKKAIKHMNDISNETILLCKNNVSTLEQLIAYQSPLQCRLQELTNKRLQCRNKIRRCPEGALKEQLKAESKSYTPTIRELRKEIQCCERIKDRSLYLQQFKLETQSRTEKGRTRL